MIFPALDDTIVAVGTGWNPSPLAIVRLSGPAAFPLGRQLGLAHLPNARGWTAGRVRADEVDLPVSAFVFPAPRSYTGQDILELHMVGCLPLLRAVCDHVLALGARRALPGEFTARAFLAGRLAAEQVDDVLSLIRSDADASARAARRTRRVARESVVAVLRERIADLLARVEAGIDFVEEEDVRFVTPAELHEALDDLLRELQAGGGFEPPLPVASPHVALIGLPNAGKSTLFNALLGRVRAIVSPVLGTTRDILTAEIEFGPVRAVLQDTAGLGVAADELELAAHRAAESVAERADLVLCVHPLDAAWDARVENALRGVPEQRRVLVWSKADRAAPGPRAEPPVRFCESLTICALSGQGLPALRQLIGRQLLRVSSAESGGAGTEHEFPALAAALERARQAAGRADAAHVQQPELVALELRTAWQHLTGLTFGTSVDTVLHRIFAQFCVGK